jgi:hypothetical protein
MGDGYTSSFGLNAKPPSRRLGEELRLELDPRFQIWMGKMLMEGDLGRARTYALSPNWRGLDVESQAIFGPRLSPSSADPAAAPVFRPLVTTPIPLCPSSKPPDPPKPPKPGEEPPKPKPGDFSDLLSAVSKTEQYQCSVGRVFDMMERTATKDWRSLSTGEKAIVITSTALIGGGAVSGLLSNQEGRKLALDKLLGADIPVPGVRGFSFKILRSDEVPGQPKPTDATPRPVGMFFTLDVPKFLQNFQRLPSFKANY